MGIWEGLRLTVSKLLNGNVSDILSTSKDCGAPSHLVVAAAFTQIGGDAVRTQKLKEYVPRLDRRDNIGRILNDIGKFSVDSAANVPVNDFSVSAGGIQVCKTLKEHLPLRAANGNEEPDLTIMIEKMQAKMEEMQEGLNNLKQENDVSTQYAQRHEPSNELASKPIKLSTPLKTDVKRVMIRSRL